MRGGNDGYTCWWHNEIYHPLIIFVVSEKKAFEHFPIGSNVNLCIAVVAILDFIKAKLYMNVHWMVLYKLYVFCYDMKFKMAATAGLSLTLDPMGKMFQSASSLKPLWQYSLAIIIFVVSEKKAFEHFPIGSNVNLCIAVVAILDFRST
jgi:hypothetical protein